MLFNFTQRIKQIKWQRRIFKCSDLQLLAKQRCFKSEGQTDIDKYRLTAYTNKYNCLKSIYQFYLAKINDQIHTFGRKKLIVKKLHLLKVYLYFLSRFSLLNAGLSMIKQCLNNCI